MADESWVEERTFPKNAAETTSDGDDMFKTKERTIAGANYARKAQQSADKEHAWHDLVDLQNKCLCLGSCL